MTYIQELIVYTIMMVCGTGLFYSGYSIGHDTIQRSEKMWMLDGDELDGVYFPNDVICINMNEKGWEEVQRHLDHEAVHKMIMKNEDTCGVKSNETCWEHYCDSDMNEYYK